MGCHALLQGIISDQGLNSHLTDSWPLGHWGSQHKRSFNYRLWICALCSRYTFYHNRQKVKCGEPADRCRAGSWVGSVNQDFQGNIDHACGCLPLGTAGNPPHSVLIQADLLLQHADLQDITGLGTTHGSRTHSMGCEGVQLEGVF